MLDGRGDEHVHVWRGAIRVGEVDDAAFQLVASFHEENLARGQIRSTHDHWIGSCSDHAEVGLPLDTDLRAHS